MGADVPKGAWVTEAASVVSNEPNDGSMYHLTLHAPAVAALAGPGQFVALQLAELEFLLPRPFDLHFAEPDSGRIEVVYRLKGRGTQLLAGLKAGERLELQGPFGRAVDPLLEDKTRIALVGRGAGISPLNFIARRAHQKGVAVSAYLSVRNERLLEPFRAMVEIAEVVQRSDDLDPGHLVSDDFAADLQARPVEMAVAVGSRRLAKATLALGQQHGFRAFAFSETYMGCGFGHCKACAIPTRDGYVLGCIEGPAIDLCEVSDEYWANIPS